ncbi:MAG: hypothetical protein V9F01_04875 [Chitinophagaceae bacterium]
MAFSIFHRIYSAGTMFLLLLAGGAAAQNDNSGNDIETYFNQLPDSCFYLCDWRKGMAETGIRTVDIRNGFISFKRRKDEIDFFQAAVFKGSNSKRFVAVSTRECEAFACFNPRSYFFLRQKEGWVQADSVLTGGVNLQFFYSDTSVYPLLEKYKGYFHYNYILPRKGTTIKVELEVCDYITEDHPEVTDTQYLQLVKKKQPVLLVWSRLTNRFRLVKVKE